MDEGGSATTEAIRGDDDALFARWTAVGRRRRWSRRRLQAVGLALGIPLLVVMPWSGTPSLPLMVLVVVVAGVAALVLAHGGVYDRLVRWPLQAVRREHPHEPWLWDHAWDPTAVSGSWLERCLAAMDAPRERWTNAIVFGVGAGLLTLIAQPLSATLWIVGAVTLRFAWFAWRFHGYGTPRVSFTRFPYAPGETVTLHFGMCGGNLEFRRVAFRLRRVRETSDRWCTSEFAGIARPRGAPPGPDRDVAVAFDVPADAGGTRLSVSPPEYWHLDVVGETSAGPYAESFLVPIYEQPAAAGTAA